MKTYNRVPLKAKRCPLFLKFHKLWSPQSISRSLFPVTKRNIHSLPQPRGLKQKKKSKSISVQSIKPTNEPSSKLSIPRLRLEARDGVCGSRKSESIVCQVKRRTCPVPRERRPLTRHCHGCNRFWRCKLHYPELGSSFRHAPRCSEVAFPLFESPLLRLLPVLYGRWGRGRGVNFRLP